MTEKRKYNRKGKRSGGFTLMEMLIVVGILVVLLGVVMLSLSAIRRNLRQKELDSKAEIIYVAAQNRMAELRASGFESSYMDGTVMAHNPTNGAITTLCYATSGEKEDATSVAASILPSGSIDLELWEHHWIVEYEPKSGNVYAVFYGETDEQMTQSYSAWTKDFNALRQSRTDGTIGYYGGDAVQIEDTTKLSPKISILNEEELTATFSCDSPKGAALTFKITISDGTHTVTSTLGPEKLTAGIAGYTYTWVLDSLNPGKRFATQFPDLTPGVDLTISLHVDSASILVDSADATPCTTNSLFAYDSTVDAANTAVITYGRHLQNLDSASRVNGITSAVQKRDISFRAGSDWAAAYGTLNFSPITNDQLTAYTGSYTLGGTAYNTKIDGLTIQSGADAGLFASFGGGTLQDITLTGTKLGETTATVAATSTGSVGALAGTLTGTTQVTGCGVYLLEEDYQNQNESHIWISGHTAGGLIGTATKNSTVIISDSFAATSIKGMTVGGLIGNAEGAVTINTSYADCYLYGETTGGLAGTGSSSIDSCYAAGFQTANQTAAGLIAGTLTAAKNSYSACDFTDHSAVKYYSTAISGSNNKQVFYLGTSINLSFTFQPDLKGTKGVNTDTLNSSLSAPFKAAAAGTTTPYNLDGFARTDYSYPSLPKLAHYGDWVITFEPGALVYYEAYSDGTYGFYGANVNKLRNDKTVIGDGYAIVYDTDDIPNNTKITHYLDGTKTESINLKKADMKQCENGAFSLYLLDKQYLFGSTPGTGFYQRLDIFKITGSGGGSGSDNHTAYWFNPYFAKTVVKGESYNGGSAVLTPPATPKTVVLRTARHLYNMSQYYTDYFSKFTTASMTYKQELTIDYASYTQWNSCTTFGVTSVSKQEPIGSSAAPFNAAYDGTYHEVNGISFASARNPNVGLFAVNAGSVQNLFLAAKTNAANRDSYLTVDYTSTIQGYDKLISLGVLAGTNRGTIANCSVSGYTAALNAYRNSTLQLGGLVGVNQGTIHSCQAQLPSVSLTSNYATVRAGGLAGVNTQVISNSYAVTGILLQSSKTSDVQLGGFAASNRGVIRASYCASALTASGDASVYGFTPLGGTVSNCYYLDGGTYLFAGNLYAYNSSENGAKGDPSAQEISGEKLSVLKLDGFTGATASTSYYHGYSGQTDAAYPYPVVVRNEAGTGLHFGDWTIEADIGAIGVFYWEYESGGSNSGYHFSYLCTQDGEQLSGSTLCSAHDDGGIITDYGYGYYYSTENEDGVTLRAPAFNVANATENATANRSLAYQMPEYTFHAFSTVSKDATDTELRLNSNAANGTWELTYAPGESQTSITYSYTLCPYFANSFNYIRADGKSAEPGSEEIQYEIRSVEQLQFINWNSYTQKANSVISTENSALNSCFPYLVYVSGNYASARSWNYHWKQTHDVDNESKNFTPIGSLFDADTTNTSFTKAYIAYFGGVYNGNTYTIKNLSISSTSQCVGLFGITVGAKLENIVLYSEHDNVIEQAPGGTNWYCVGGLVGFAATGNNTSSTFTNCTVSGYVLKDLRDQNGGWGGANIGGLVGATNMDIEGCTAVTHIIISYTYGDRQGYVGGKLENIDGYKNIRVGGLAGGCRSTISNSYCGGEIESTVTSRHGGDGETSNIWIGGLVGGIYMRNDGNLGNLVGSVTQQAKVENCYSYVKLPASGTNQIKSVQSIASNGEMQSAAFASVKNPNMQIENCYCFSSLAENADDYQKFKSSWYWYKLDLNTQNQAHIYLYNSRSPYLSYADMTNRLQSWLGNPFTTVTTTENNATINGKYSYCCGKTPLEGQDYPFPTILTQTDLVSHQNEVNVHYGVWPMEGLYWENRTETLDLLADYQDGSATKTVHLIASGSAAKLVSLSDADIQITGAIPEIGATVELVGVVQNGDGWDVRFKGLKEGTSLINVTASAYGVNVFSTELAMTVTANVEVTLDPAEAETTLKLGDTRDVTLSATASTTTGNSLPVIWEVTSSNEGVVMTATTGNTLSISGMTTGITVLTITGTYRVNETDETSYSGTKMLIVNVEEIGVVGLASGDTYNQTNIRPAAWVATTLYGAATDGEAPGISANQPYFYSTGLDVSEFQLVSATINGVAAAVNGAAPTIGADGIAYALTLGETLMSGTDYAKEISISSSVPLNDAALVLTLQYGNSTYVLSGIVSCEAMNVTVTFVNEQGETIGEPTELLYGGTAKLPDAETGFFYQLTSGSFTPIFENTTYALTKLYNVTFHANYGTEQDASETQAIASGVDIASKAIFAPQDGYEFLGWAQTSDGEILSNAIDLGETDLYAIWGEIVTDTPSEQEPVQEPEAEQKPDETI